MNQINISQDDLLDIQELTLKLGSVMAEILKGHERNIIISALMSAFITAIIKNSKNFDEVKMHFSFLPHIMNSSIDEIEQAYLEGKLQDPLIQD